MSWRIVGELLDVRLSKLTSSDKFLLVALARYSDESGGKIFPSVETLARNVNLSVSQVQKILRKLEKLAYVMTVGRHGGGGHWATRVRCLNLELLRHDADYCGQFFLYEAARAKAPHLFASTVLPVDDEFPF